MKKQNRKRQSSNKQRAVVKNTPSPRKTNRAHKITNSASEVNFYRGGSNSTYRSFSGMGGSQDRAAGFITNYLTPSRILHPRELEFLYEKDWQVEKIVKIVIDDAMRVPWEYKGLTEEQSRAVRTFEKELDVPEILHKALLWERLYGRAAIVLGISDNITDPSTPAGDGELKYIYPVSGNLLHSSVMNINPLSPRFGKPDKFRVNSVDFDESRMLVFNGGSIKIPGQSNAGGWGAGESFFGNSVVQPLFNDLVNATASRSGAFHLLQMASRTFLTGDFQTMQETKSGEAHMAMLHEMMRQQSIYHSSVIDTKNTDAEIKTVDVNLSGVTDLAKWYVELLAAAIDIPQSRFLGNSPGGLNTNGEGDLKNYHVKIDSIRQKKIKPVIERILEFANKQVLGNIDLTQVEIEFPPLSPKSDLEEAQINNTRANTIATLTTTAGALTEDEGRALGKDWGMYDFKDDTAFKAKQEALNEPGLNDADQDNEKENTTEE